MRHRKDTFKIGRTASHRRCMIANMLKALIEHGRIKTTKRKAVELKRHADGIITLAKKNTIDARRRAIAKLMISFNPLTSKEARAAKTGNKIAFNSDRIIIGKLFGELAGRFAERQGGYTRVINGNTRIGDNALTCILEYLT